MNRGTIFARAAAFILLLSLSLSLSACGGRTTHPIAATTPYDGQLTCEHVQAEREVNEAHIADLKNEEQDDNRNNVAFIVTGGIGGALAMDASHSEETEIAALKARDDVLDGLIAEKCGGATGSTP
ncbi:MAG: hypothetical protein ACREED_01665 [Stellaceae bacterium]